MRSDGGGAFMTWSTAKQYSGNGMSFGDEATEAQRSGTWGGMSSGREWTRWLHLL
jgi:hypothetical protein